MQFDIQAYLDKITDFIVSNRQGKAFSNWTREQIQVHILKAIPARCFACTVNEEHKITGVILARHTGPLKLHIINILTTDRKAFPLMIKYFFTTYAEYWTITGNRNGKLVTYNPKKLCRFLKNT